VGKRRRKKKAEKKRRDEEAEDTAKVIARPTPGLVIHDPIAELIERMERAQQEYDQIMREIKASIAKLEDGHEDALGHAEEMVEQDRKGMTLEELRRAREIAGREQLREIGEMRAEVERQAKELLTGPKMTFLPQVDDVIPIGGAKFVFEAFVEAKYPRQAIEAYEQKRRSMSALERTKKMLGAAGPGYADELVPVCVADFTGHPRRPLAEHRALLEAAGIEQTLGG